MLSTPYLHTGWAFENCALGCSLGLIFSGYVPLATSSPGFDPLAGGGGGGKQGALWEMCKWRIVKTDLSTEAQVPTPQYGQYFTHAHNHITPVMSHGQL